MSHVYKLCLRCGQEGHTSSSCKSPIFSGLVRAAKEAAQ